MEETATESGHVEHATDCQAEAESDSATSDNDESSDTDREGGTPFSKGYGGGGVDADAANNRSHAGQLGALLLVWLKIHVILFILALLVGGSGYLLVYGVPRKIGDEERTNLHKVLTGQLARQLALQIWV
jgi:hypothetical protein